MFLLALTLTLSAQAQADAPQIRIPEIQEIGEGEFQRLEVEGQLIGPDGVVQSERRVASFPSWIELRRDFRAELRDSLTELK
jgi:hypothetical protein